MTDAGPPRFRVLLYCFDGMTTADYWLSQIDEAQELNLPDVVTHAVVQREPRGEVHVKESGRAGRGAALGAASTMTAAALLGGPIGVVTMAVVGGVVGGVMGHMAGRVIPVKELEQVGYALPPDSSAIAILVKEAGVPDVERLMAGRDARTVSLEVGEELSGVIGVGLSEELAAARADGQGTGTGTSTSTG